ncbi:winged helix-turn-helix domain-containing protein [Halomonas huangheensis]|uniref:Cytoplasmic protein n=1 Tax=Halomonas huangheensis TaxID=1178482 RepID=W1N6U6_9GAMM|nr:crosslink repair DNA glycosylase YcaQ family protein [Halomonas huangheensis]ALM50979.1 cytoplasmic protein [Halomonas huangheensis]ERL51282.1 hypothetical protein BJB45_15375 [Halomonas huangheensis]
MPSSAISPEQARAIWLRAQRLDRRAPFGNGPSATLAAIEQLGYVQIDTIYVIERSHHHILYTRIPEYRRNDLEHAQSTDKSVFEYWTHALSYVPTADYRYFMPAMTQHRKQPSRHFATVKRDEYSALLKRIRHNGALSIRDIDEPKVEKDHLWGSTKPSRKLLKYGFYSGDLAISERQGMLKSYELTKRHFEWQQLPRPATERQLAHYYLSRALRAQGVVSLDSICYGHAAMKPLVARLIDTEVRQKRLRPVHIDSHTSSHTKFQHWAEPETLDQPTQLDGAPLVHILSPFDPLVIQRKRLKLFFDYEHRFEAYVPPVNRVFGYFALPVLIGDQIAAVLDLKTDRQQQKILVQKWTWIAPQSAELRAAIEAELERFERFQLA